MKWHRGVSLLISASVLACGAAVATAQELAPRKDMSALDRAKTHSVMSKRWLGFGATQQTTDTSSTAMPTAGSVGGKVCTTNVGVPVEQTGVSSGRYGPRAQKDNIVVVKGDIISICK